MLKLELNNGQVQAEISGTIGTILTDMSYSVLSVLRKLCSSADEYNYARSCIINCLNGFDFEDIRRNDNEARKESDSATEEVHQI